MNKTAFLVILFVLGAAVSRAQTDIPYYEVIEGDSVHLFLESASLFSSSSTKFTGKACARGYRAVRISAGGKFNGPFQDFYVMGRGRPESLMAEGNYRDGKKSGAFYFYFPNGSMMTTGSYIEDQPAGEWKFFNDKEVLVMLLRFGESAEPKILYLLDDANNLAMVKDGAGEARFVAYGEFPYVVSGRVKDGLPDGLWFGELEAMSAGGRYTKWTRQETYKEGKMVEGKKVQSGRIMNTCCTPVLSKVFPTPPVIDLLYLETFPIEGCPTLPSLADLPPPKSAVPVSGLLTFRSSVKEIVRGKYYYRNVGESISPTGMGSDESKLVIHFNTNEKGTPVKTRMMSGYGREFFMPIARALETQTQWQPNQEGLVLTLYIRMSVNTYGIRMYFSPD